MVAATLSPSAPLPARDIPSLGGSPFFGRLRDMKADPLSLMEAAFREKGDLAWLRLGPVRYLVVSHPHDVHRILVDNARNYQKTTRGYQVLRKVLGDGLVTSNGEFWLKQRRTIQPAFHKERIVGFADTMVNATTDMLERWPTPQGGDAPVLDVSAEMMQLTLRIIGLTMLSFDFKDEALGIGDAVTVALHRADELITELPGVDRLPTRKNRQFKKAQGLLDGVIFRTLAERRAAMASDQPVPSDLLTMLLEAEDPETGDRMNDQQLRDELMTIFLAGHETTANALTWSFHLLGQHPEVRRRLYEEVDGAGTGPFTLRDLGRLPYTKQVIQEAMRLLPPVGLLGRDSIEGDVLGGYSIPAKTNHFISPWVVHRHPAFWDRPEVFDPDRFEGDPRFEKGSYIPFIEGPRMCIGKAFALMEAHLLLANIARRFQLDPVPGHRVDKELAITVRPVGGLPMRLTPREE